MRVSKSVCTSRRVGAGTERVTEEHNSFIDGGSLAGVRIQVRRGAQGRQVGNEDMGRACLDEALHVAAWSSAAFMTSSGDEAPSKSFAPDHMVNNVSLLTLGCVAR